MISMSFVAKVKKDGRYLRIKQDKVGTYTTKNLSVAFKRKNRDLVEKKLEDAAPFLWINERLSVEDFELVEI